MTLDLQELRVRLDAVDARLLDLLLERQDLIRQVVHYKQATGAPLRDVLREADQMRRLAEAARARGLDPHLATQLLQRILDHSVKFQEALLSHGESAVSHQIVVSYQGTAGAYSQIAAEQHFGPRGVTLETRGYDTFAAILEAVSSGEADYAMLPVENTTAGSINDAYDLLASTELVVVGEEVLRVQHCLVALPGAQLEGIRRVYSHPQGLLQCARFLSQLPDCATQAFVDTAMSVVKVRDEQRDDQAAIASERAATLYGLAVLARDIADQRHNFTRFMVVGRKPIQYDRRISCKTSLIFATAHSEGALVRCLGALAARSLNLTKLESRPRPGKPFEYLFYLDFEGNVVDEEVRNALTELKQHTKFLKVLGSYPSRTTQEREASPKRGGDQATRSLLVGSHQLGGGASPLLLMGMRAVRDEAQVKQLARMARDSGAAALHLPCFSPPRTPGEYPGPGPGSLSMFARVAHSFELPLASNVALAPDVRELSRVAEVIEILGEQLGDFGLLEQSGRVDRPVLCHRDLHTSDEDLLAALAHVRRFGNQQVAVCQPVPRALIEQPELTAIAALTSTLRMRDAAPICLSLTVTPSQLDRLSEAVFICLQSGAEGLLVIMDLADGEAPSAALCHAAAAGMAAAAERR